MTGTDATAVEFEVDTVSARVKVTGTSAVEIEVDKYWTTEPGALLDGDGDGGFSGPPDTN